MYEHPRESKGRPGSRAPHVFLERDGTRLSTLDLFGRNFVLLAGLLIFELIRTKMSQLL